MKRMTVSIVLGLCLIAGASFAVGENVRTAEPFRGTVLADGLEMPWEMLWGPDDMLWVTERMGKRITRVNPVTGEKKVAALIDGAFAGPQHEGVLGMAFAPDMTAASGHVYVVYTHKGQVNGKDGEWSRIIRLDYDGAKEILFNPVIILDGIPAGDDHNGGRLLFGPDGKLYMSMGELGHNQFGSKCKPIEAQRLPTAKELADKDYSAYVGKILRMNPDGAIPADNPELGGVRSHVFTYGHRNPQGLVFVGGNLFSCEHGPSSDDEINLIVSGGNYGWPHVAGYLDDNSYRYANYSAAPNCGDLAFDPNAAPAEVPVMLESQWEAPANFHEPVKTFYTVPKGFNFNDDRCKGASFLCWPTIALSSIAYYPEDGPIPGWGNSLLVTSLKNGALYRVPLNNDKATVQGDQTTYFHTPNRYRVARLSPDGKTVYIATDNAGYVFDFNGRPTRTMANPGAIIKFEYTE